MKHIFTISLLIISNFFMTLAWYGHLQFKKITWLQSAGLVSVILISWFLALFEYIFQVPANKIGYIGNGGPYNLFQLKTIQEVISLAVFSFTAIFIFKTETLKWNYAVAFFCLVLAVYFVFKK
ncbi:MAG: DMT family protein [Cytophagales bacterium]|nr:DMT family protein [Cytophagales bacterium]